MQAAARIASVVYINRTKTYKVPVFLDSFLKIQFLPGDPP